ncbi:chemotaxis protein CheB [Rufibacter quisquiliarum]|uniref:histidine kinase n=1 Tax=Rufibacter quisquiliarum TaxID=1549639 RepID=A0A839GWI7_9BACT|nr:chemotaxis protein CheB [Rufibacter quisquiliarum]MBA9078778.1 two-component system CheB/CheR fusion protein [Rufibacter quisquiliarum]
MKSSHQQDTPPKTDHYLIGIGASAGGLEAIHRLFDHFPSNSSFSFVIIQHLSPDHKSLMAELLTKHTQMQVREAEDNMYTQPNCVYVLPSGKQLTLKHGRLQLVNQIRNREPNFAIDVFFESLAQDRGRYAIGIVLSGTGTDGTKGVKKIKAAGGMVMVQDPETAKFDGMPRSAIESGAVDYVFPPEQMPREIIDYTRQIPLVKTLINRQTEEEENEEEILAEILDLVCTHTQTNFKNYKQPTIYRRIRKRMDTIKVATMAAYLAFMQENPAEIKQLCQEFLIGVTRFFRDGEPFEIMAQEVIPEIISRTPEEENVKVWVTACSTGEEVYSLAILFKECYDRLGREPNVKLFATDIDQRAIRQASKGVFPAAIAHDVSEERLKNFFLFKNNRYTIKEDIRKLIIFAQHDLQKDPPFSRMDLITCRNMLIYLNPELQKKVMSVFPYALKLKGYLLLGPSESIGDLKSFFSEKNRKWKLYKKIKDNKSFQQQYGVTPLTQTFSPEYPPSHRKSNATSDQYNEAFLDAVAEDLKVAGLFVDENFQLLHGIGDFSRYLKLPEKRLHLNLLKMVSKELAVTLSVDIRKVLKTEQPVSRQIMIKSGNGNQLVHLLVKLYSAEPDMPKVTLVLLQENTQNLSLKTLEPMLSEADTGYFQQLTLLESELKDARESLHMTVQDLSTANEELQSTNEELMSSNEELQSSNEEMQSLNEELHTVNSEHQLKIKELQELNEDLDNYIRSSNIGQLFLDHHLVIRKFTPSVKELINIIEIDVGRPIHHLSHNLKYKNWLEDIKKVNHTSAEVEQEVETQDGKFFLMRIIPYLKYDGNKDGVVLSFVEVTTLKALSNVVQGVLNSSLNNIMAFKAVRNEESAIIEFTWSLLNRQAEQMIGKPQEQLLGQSVQQELTFLRKSGLFKKFVHVIETGSPLHAEQYLEVKGKKSWFEIAAAKMGDGLTLTMADITEKKISEERILLAYEDLKRAEENLIKLNTLLEKRVTDRTQELLASQERFKLVSKATNDVVWDWNLITNELWWSDSLQTILGYDPSHMSKGINSWFDKIHPDDKERVMKGINDAINLGSDQWTDEFKIIRANGTYAYIYNRAYILHNEYQMPHRMLGSFIDLSDLKDTQVKLKETNAHLLRVIDDLDNFVYTASHDLKTPIHNIEALLRELKLELPEEEFMQVDVQQIMAMMQGAVERFKHTIANLTEVTKLQNDNVPEISSVNLNEVVQDVLLDLEPMIQEAQAHVKVDVRECPTILFSKKNFRSIVYNLLSNAIKYRDPEKDTKVSLTCRKEKDDLVLTVKDNGLGMTGEQEDQLFTMFRRFHDHVEGSGIGLYMVRKIVHNAGGKIQVSTRLGEGTTFKIYLKS